MKAIEAAATPHRPDPVALTGGRLASLDFIRGIAVMGILAANIVAFGQPWSAYHYPASFLTDHGPASDWLWVIQFVFVDGKMRGLFSLLFGAGMYLFMEKAWARGATSWLQVRRLLILLGFGLVHYFFIWRGDILASYACTGLVALLFLGMSEVRQFTIGLLGYLVGAIMFATSIGPLQFIAESSGDNPQLVESRAGLDRAQEQLLADDEIETRIERRGNYGDLIRHRFAKHADDPFTGTYMYILETLPLMLMGMALYRMGLFGTGFDPAAQRMWGWIGVIGGGTLSLFVALWVRSTGYDYWATIGALNGFNFIPQLLMTMGYAALLVPLGSKGEGWLHARICAAGRAAFTNYIGTSVVLMFVFHGWGLGLFGEFDRPELYLVAAAMWVLMLAWSKAWLDRFRFGPLEWLWRCLTYGRLFRLRRD